MSFFQRVPQLTVTQQTVSCDRPKVRTRITRFQVHLLTSCLSFNPQHKQLLDSTSCASLKSPNSFTSSSFSSFQLMTPEQMILLHAVLCTYLHLFTKETATQRRALTGSAGTALCLAPQGLFGVVDGGVCFVINLLALRYDI